MRGSSLLGNLTVTVAALAVLAFYGMPVYRDMNDGQATALVGNAQASAAMMYVLLAPILLSLAQGFVMRLVAVGVATAVAYVVRTWVGLVEAEAMGMALIVTVAALAALALTLVVLRMFGRRRRARVSGMAWRLARCAAEVTNHLRRRYEASPENARSDGPLNQALMVENLVFNVLAEAESAETPEAFAEILVEGLTEMREGLAANTRTDPKGYGMTAAAEYCARLGAELRHLMPDAPTLSRPSPVRRVA